MFKLFKRKTETEKLEKQYNNLLKQSFELSKSNRAESDRCYAQAQEILKKIESLAS